MHQCSADEEKLEPSYVALEVAFVYYAVYSVSQTQVLRSSKRAAATVVEELTMKPSARGWFS